MYESFISALYILALILAIAVAASFIYLFYAIGMYGGRERMESQFGVYFAPNNKQ